MKRIWILLSMLCALTAAFPAAADRGDRSSRDGEYSRRDSYQDARNDRREQERYERRQEAPRRDQMSPEQREQLRRDIYDYGRDSNRGRRGR